MRELLNKCFIFLFCTMNLIGQPVDISLISLLLLSVSVSALISYFDRERPLEYLCGGCLVLSLFLPELALFLPLFFYDFITSHCRHFSSFCSQGCWRCICPG